MITFAGISHRTAPLRVRERLAVADDSLPTLLRDASETFGGGAAVLSTCNRLEFYLSGEHPEDGVAAFLEQSLGADPEVVRRHFRFAHGPEAVSHLYRVAAGTDSMVVGETEVLGQVRSAFSAAVKAGADDAILSRLFHTAIRTGRRARNETAISARALSVSSIAAQQARALFSNLGAAAVLVIGAGEAARLAAQALVDIGVGEVIVTNRTAERADALAEALGGCTASFDALPEALTAAQIVIAAAGSAGPLVDRAAVEAAVARRDGEPLLIIDIGVPRDFDPSVRGIRGVSYHDLDDLQTVADENAEARQAEFSAVEAIVAEETARYVEWWEQLEVVPTIAALTDRAEALRRGELAKTLRRLRLGADDRRQVEELTDVLTRAVVRQILADPIAVLRERGDRDAYVDAVRALFRLNQRPGNA